MASKQKRAGKEQRANNAQASIQQEMMESVSARPTANGNEGWGTPERPEAISMAITIEDGKHVNEQAIEEERYTDTDEYTLRRKQVMEFLSEHFDFLEPEFLGKALTIIIAEKIDVAELIGLLNQIKNQFEANPCFFYDLLMQQESIREIEILKSIVEEGKDTVSPATTELISSMADGLIKELEVVLENSKDGLITIKELENLASSSEIIIANYLEKGEQFIEQAKLYSDRVSKTIELKSKENKTMNVQEEVADVITDNKTTEQPKEHKGPSDMSIANHVGFVNHVPKIVAGVTAMAVSGFDMFTKGDFSTGKIISVVGSTAVAVGGQMLYESNVDQDSLMVNSSVAAGIGLATGLGGRLLNDMVRPAVINVITGETPEENIQLVEVEI